MKELALLTNFPLIQILLAVLSILMGLFVFFKPELTIEIQKRIYAGFNWRIEPISLPKEIRNTKIMGMLLVFVAIVSIICSCSK